MSSAVDEVCFPIAVAPTLIDYFWSIFKWRSVGNRAAIRSSATTVWPLSPDPQMGVQLAAQGRVATNVAIYGRSRGGTTAPDRICNLFRAVLLLKSRADFLLQKALYLVRLYPFTQEAYVPSSPHSTDPFLHYAPTRDKQCCDFCQLCELCFADSRQMRRVHEYDYDRKD